MGTKRAFAVILATLLAVALIGCVDGPAKTEPTASTADSTDEPINTTEPTQSQKEVVSLKVMTRYPFSSVSAEGRQEDIVTKEIEKITMTELDFVNFDEEKFKLWIASGDIPDIVQVNKDMFGESLLNAQLIIALDDLLQSNGPNIVKNTPVMLNYSKTNVSHDEKTYYLLPMVGPDLKQLNYDLAFFLTRWDFYKELGYPEIKNADDVIDLMVDMQDKHPTTPEGKKVYALGGHADAWTTCGFWPINVVGGWLDAKGRVPGFTGLYEATSDYKFNHMLASEDSVFWQGVKFFNKAAQKGLVDPEMFVQKADINEQKIVGGQYLFPIGNWWADAADRQFVEDGHPDWGFEPLPTYLDIVAGSWYSPVGYTDQLTAIAKSCETPERAMDFLDFFYTTDGVRLVMNGIKGEHWDVVDGVPLLNEETYDGQLNDPNWSKTVGTGKLMRLIGFNNIGDVPDKDGQPVTLFSKSQLDGSANSAVDQDYCDHYGINIPSDLINNAVEAGELRFVNYDAGISMSNVSDDIMRIDKALQDALVQALPKIILAKTDAEYDAEVSQLMDTLRQLGLDTQVEWYDKAWSDWAAAYTETLNTIQ